MLRRQRLSPVIVLSLAAASTIVIASMALPAPGGIRLHPGLFPAALACLVAASCFVVMSRPAAAGSTALAPAGRAVVATASAMLVLALATRPGGVFLATLASATIASIGVAGVSWRRASLVGLCLATGVSACLALIARQPLPILPPGLLR